MALGVPILKHFRVQNIRFTCIHGLITSSATNNVNTVELQWLEHLWDYENVFEIGVVRANEC